MKHQDLSLFVLMSFMFMAYIYIETQKMQYEITRERKKEPLVRERPRVLQVAHPLPINTRHVNHYRVIGYLQQADGERILPLYGRRLHVSSTLWNYYTRTDHDRSMLLPIVLNGQRCTERYGCKELYDDDIITIPEYGGNYIVHLY